MKIESNESYVKSLPYTTYYLSPADYSRIGIRPFSMFMIKDYIFYPELYQKRFQRYINYLSNNHLKIYNQLKEITLQAQCYINTANYAYELNHYTYLYKLSQNEHILERIQIIPKIEILESHKLRKIRLATKPIDIDIKTSKILINEPTYQLVIYNSFKNKIEIIETPFLELISDRRNLRNLHNNLHIYQLHLSRKESNKNNYIYTREYTWNSFIAPTVIYPTNLTDLEKIHYINCQSYYYHSYADQSTFTDFHHEANYLKTDEMHKYQTFHFFRKLKTMTYGKDNIPYFYFYYLKRYSLIVLNSIRKIQSIRRNIIRVIQSQYFHKFRLYKQIYQHLHRYQPGIQLFQKFNTYYRCLYNDRSNDMYKKHLSLAIYQLQPTINIYIYLPQYVKLYKPIEVTLHQTDIMDIIAQEIQRYIATGMIQIEPDTSTYKTGIFTVNRNENNTKQITKNKYHISPDIKYIFHQFKINNQFIKNRIDNYYDRIENNTNKIDYKQNRNNNIPTEFNLIYVRNLIATRQIIQSRKKIIIEELQSLHTQYINIQARKFDLMHKYNQVLFNDKIPSNAQLEKMQKDIEDIAADLIAINDRNHEAENEFKYISMLQDSIMVKEQNEEIKTLRLTTSNQQLKELIDCNNDLLIEWDTPQQSIQHIKHKFYDINKTAAQYLLLLDEANEENYDLTNDEYDDKKDDTEDDISQYKN